MIPTKIAACARRIWFYALFSIPLYCVAATSGSREGLRVEHLTCEYLSDPVGIGEVRPRLGWMLESETRGQKQTAYQVLVASSQALLDRDTGDLWDSGKVESDQSIQVKYEGGELKSHRQCFWKVRVWDKDGECSGWSQPGSWSMGLLDPTDWRGKWIGKDEQDRKTVLKGADWIWFPEEEPPPATRYFRRTVDLPEDRAIKSAQWCVVADNLVTIFVNGRKIGEASTAQSARRFDVTEALHAGPNVLAASVENMGDAPNPAGLLARLRVEFESGEPLDVATDGLWKSSDTGPEGWEQPAFADSAWIAAKNLGPNGIKPWGEICEPEERRLPARWLRKEFQVAKPVRRATVSFSGLGLSELYLNGKKISDDVLSPALSDYTKRDFYVTRDVTGLLKSGGNAIGVVLGNGRFYAPRLQTPMQTNTYGFPKLLLLMRLEYEDGTDEVVSDESWRLTDAGPIRANNEYDGEEYDARMEMAGWAEPGFDDSKWESPQLVAAPGGEMAPQMIPPIRITGTLKPVSVSEPRPGVFVFDMGQNMVGWCRIKVAGPAGTQVSLRHAETLQPDGTLYLANIRDAKVTDKYTLKGGGEETWEPRFTYHGFRFVEVTGWPGRPSLDSIEGRLVNDDVTTAGEFSCSNPMVNRIYQNVVRGVRGNYRSIPTDCPQRDERQGWLGDRSVEAKGETFLFHVAPLYSKWTQDMLDAQKPSGSVPDVCPPYWPLYNDSVTWPSSVVLIPGALRDQYGDMSVIEKRYPGMAKWVDYMSGFIKDGIISKDSYGDWCVPPEDNTMIHSKDPARKTAPAILATTYFYHCLNLMAGYAAQLGKPEDASRFTALAAQLKTALNRKFYDPERGYYGNGSQTSCVLPLAFDMVPEDQRGRVFDHLVNKITDESKGHIGTGLIGGQWLNRVLTEGGREDLAYGFATTSTYPGWGYMIEQGATTIWELWNGNTANPAMNSGNHVMLVGDFVIWLYEDLAGIKSDPKQPGFKHILMRPQPVGDLSWVKATHDSPYGRITSDWKIENGLFHWNFIIPANTTATVSLPVCDASIVKAGGKPLEHADGVKILKPVDGRLLCDVVSGTYEFKFPWPGETNSPTGKR